MTKISMSTTNSQSRFYVHNACLTRGKSWTSEGKTGTLTESILTSVTDVYNDVGFRIICRD